MTSRPGASIAQPSWGTPAAPSARAARRRPARPCSGPVVRWGARGSAAADVAAAAAAARATAGLWTAVLLAVW